MLLRIRTLYQDGALSWRNPLMLGLYCVFASVVMLLSVLNSQSTWVTATAVAVWVFTGGVLCLCIMIVVLGAFSRRRKKCAHDDADAGSTPSVHNDR